ncbi:hypothetical protein SAMN05660860_02456 [Geoalkalibacter ferrihydriticus]|uniref:Uncharacterized protein n=2 Tax=Geoalkalibacter ferrihydriticus TaxID=392333 RepID=A0A0C2HYR3_9BACT|nr:hypothetical protein [Geoalkalibacter ferrihydriticus]KIH77902.1 hypothetical protein GFER_04590 [Geoalkalibacter ferrihydriticus DSM 17813]SDM38280.1 hypothetical protein SAMN05660860_02456 [Geoalkalibacter ferrihydriticus]
MKEKLLLILSTVLLLGFLSPTLGLATECLTLRGQAYTNSLSEVTTMGSARLKGIKGVDLRCGLQGALQGINQDDGSLYFKHTVVCDDHTVFILDSHTVMQVEGDCQAQGRPGIIAGFEESSSMVGVDGPFAGWAGTAWISGRAECGWNRMEVKAEICGAARAPGDYAKPRIPAR